VVCFLITVIFNYSKTFIWQTYPRVLKCLISCGFGWIPQVLGLKKEI